MHAVSQLLQVFVV